jgi:predicted DNA-binding transcriptional regulator YafY
MSKVGIIQRYLLIIRKIRNERHISLENLTNQVEKELSYYGATDTVGVSKRTIQRDFRDIRVEFGIDIDYSKSHNGYSISESAQSDIERILEPFDLLGALYTDKSLQNCIFTEKRKSKGTEHLSSLIFAIKNDFITEFFYLKYDNSFSHVRKVQPYALKEFKGRWYLLAIEIDGRPEEWGMIKSWGLDRIQKLEITRKRFNKNPQINIEDEFRNTFGIYSDKDKEAEEVILSFTPQGGKYNESFPLHESQQTLIDNEEEFRIKLNVKLTYDFMMELLSQSDNMKVIAPAHLKDALIDIHKNAIQTLESNE